MNSIASHPNPSAFLPKNPPPLSSAPSEASAPKFNLYFKCENNQKIGAFKARGAHHALIRLISEHGIDHVRSHGVVTHSSGNHAQALALAAHNFDVPSYIVMPAISTPSKIAGTQMYTPNVIFSGSTSTEREAKVEEVIGQTGAILIPPYDHPDIILGQGTAAYEMERQFIELKKVAAAAAASLNPNGISTAEESPEPIPHFDAVLTPLGGGGLLGGTATYFSSSPSSSSSSSSPSKPTTLVFGSEPSFSGANDAELGLKATPPTRVAHVSSLTIADGLRTPVGVWNWRIVSDRSKVAGVYSVTERQITDALRLVMERCKMFVEPSAVVPVAVVLFCEEFRHMVVEMQRKEGGRAWDVGIVLSGGNTTVEAVAKLFGEADRERDGEREISKVGIDGVRKAEDVAG